MVIIMCEMCDFQGDLSLLPKERFEEVIEHEHYSHRNIRDECDLAFEQALERREEEIREGGLCK